MNDFTKEELEEMRAGVGWMYSEQIGCVGDNIIQMWSDLENKLQSLIDNYCFHEDLATCPGQADVCNDCGRTVEW